MNLKRCLTEFIKDQIELEVPDEPSTELYTLINQQNEENKVKNKLDIIKTPRCTVLEWDW